MGHGHQQPVRGDGDGVTNAGAALDEVIQQPVEVRDTCAEGVWAERAWAERACSERAWAERAWAERAWAERAWAERAWAERVCAHLALCSFSGRPSTVTDKYCERAPESPSGLRVVDIEVGLRRELSSSGREAPGTRRVSLRRASAVLRA